MSESTSPTTGRLSIERDDRPPIVVTALHGDVDLATAPAMRAALDDALADAPPVLVLDLSGVQFMASVGLTALVVLARDIPDGTELRIVASGRATLRPIQLTGLEQTLPLYPTIEAALA